jgi:hypothetical protein
MAGWTRPIRSRRDSLGRFCWCRLSLWSLACLACSGICSKSHAWSRYTLWRCWSQCLFISPWLLHPQWHLQRSCPPATASRNPRATPFPQAWQKSSNSRRTRSASNPAPASSQNPRSKPTTGATSSSSKCRFPTPTTATGPSQAESQAARTVAPRPSPSTKWPQSQPASTAAAGASPPGSTCLRT